MVAKKKKKPTAAKKKSALHPKRRKQPTGIEALHHMAPLLASIAGGALSAMQPHPIMIDYHEMLHMISDFGGTLLNLSLKDMNPLERERFNVASREIVEMLQEKYSMKAGEAAILLLNLGSEMLLEMVHEQSERG